MNLRQEALERLESHWAVAAISADARQQAAELAQTSLVQKAVGRQLHLPMADSAHAEDLLKRVALAYEMAAIEGLPAFLNQLPEQDDLRLQCVAGAWRAFEFRRLMPVTTATEERIFQVLHVASLAYCGDRWSDIRRWFTEN